MARLPFPEVEQGPLRVLLRELHLLHAQAGWPSTRALAKGQAFSHVAVHDLMTKATGTPRLPVLLAVVARMAASAPRTDFESTLDDFDKMWRECLGDVVRPAQEVSEPTEWTDEDPAALPAWKNFDQLTHREREILSYLANGFTIEQVAAQLFVSLSSIRAHVSRITQKLGAESRKEAIEAYKRNRLQAQDKPTEPDGDG